MFGIPGTSTKLYLCICICICVFVYLTVGNISFDVLGPWAFQKYSSIRFSKIFWAWWRPTDRRTNNNVNLEQVCSLNSEQSRLLQYILSWRKISFSVYRSMPKLEGRTCCKVFSLSSSPPMLNDWTNSSINSCNSPKWIQLSWNMTLLDKSLNKNSEI